MPITYDVDEEQNLVLVKVSGEFTDEIVLQFERDFIADRRVKPGFRALFDARAVQVGELSYFTPWTWQECGLISRENGTLNNRDIVDRRYRQEA